MKKPFILITAFIGIALLGYFTTIRISITSEHNEPRTRSQSQALKSLRGEIIYLESPRAGEKIFSPLTVKGRARGKWFFEASFPITLTDWDGRIIAQSHAAAILNPSDPKSTWMTDDYVPFEGTIAFENPSWEAEFSKRGMLILQKDNPSGLPENEDAVELTVYFQ
jgi:hypothetical protein